MNQIYPYSTPEGPINLIEGDKMPVQPHYGICETEPRPDCFNKSNCLCAEKWKPYREALQAAKESSVPIQNREVAKGLIYTSGQADIADVDIKPDTIYGPFTVGYEIRKKCRYSGDCPDCSLGLLCDKVAILYDDTPEKEQTPEHKLIDFLKRAAKGHTEFRVVVREDGTAYSHVMGMDSETFDFKV